MPEPTDESRSDSRGSPNASSSDPRGEPADLDAGADPSVAEGPAPPSGARRWLAILVRAGALVLVVVAVVAGGAAYWLRAHLPELVRAEVVRRAEAMGLEIESGTIEAHGVLPWETGPQEVVITELVVRVRSAPGAELRAERAEVALVEREPESVTLTGLRVGAPRVRALVALMEAGQAKPLSLVPLTAKHAKIHLDELAPAAPLALDISVASIATKDGVLSLEGLEADVVVPFVDVHLGPLPFTLKRKKSSSIVTPSSPAGVTLELDDDATRLGIELVRVRAADLRPLLRIQLPDVVVDGKLDVDVSRSLAPRATFDVELDGYTPPHPPELGGIVFGKRTRAKGAARLVFAKLLLDDVTLSAGSLTLSGTGDAELTGEHRLHLDLSGAIPCAELAASAAGAHFGWEGSVLTGRLARGRLTGTVGVVVQVEASLDDLDHAIATPYAVVRCGVKL
ncbi:MAG TPA: hypothetical protein VL400_11680 [Polyangiaceae bacterium]|nr:hypothetical protein [Polyangiaceae bacterium]